MHAGLAVSGADLPQEHASGATTLRREAGLAQIWGKGSAPVGRRPQEARNWSANHYIDAKDSRPTVAQPSALRAVR